MRWPLVKALSRFGTFSGNFTSEQPTQRDDTVDSPARLEFSRMVKAWLVWLELARDDGGSLSDEGIVELTDLLTKNRVQPLFTRRDSGTVLVQMTLDATNDRAARTAAESMLRDRAHKVWLALGLPPFTITFVEAKLAADR